MQVQILEFKYDTANPDEVETDLNNFLEHHEIIDVQVTRWEDQLLVFAFLEE
jgi:hypothetical protein